MEPVAVAGDLLPGLVRVGEAGLGVLVMLGLEALGDPDERLAGLVVDAFVAEDDPAQLDRGVAQGMAFDGVGGPPVEEDRQVARPRDLVVEAGEAAVAIRPTGLPGLAILDLLEDDVVNAQGRSPSIRSLWSRRVAEPSDERRMLGRIDPALGRSGDFDHVSGDQGGGIEPEAGENLAADDSVGSRTQQLESAFPDREPSDRLVFDLPDDGFPGPMKLILLELLVKIVADAAVSDLDDEFGGTLDELVVTDPSPSTVSWGGSGAWHRAGASFWA